MSAARQCLAGLEPTCSPRSFSTISTWRQLATPDEVAAKLLQATKEGIVKKRHPELGNYSITHADRVLDSED